MTKKNGRDLNRDSLVSQAKALQTAIALPKPVNSYLKQLPTVFP